MDGPQGAELARRLGFPHVLPVHYDDYSLFRSPLEEFLTEADRLGLGERVIHYACGRHARVVPGGDAPTVR